MKAKYEGGIANAPPTDIELVKARWNVYSEAGCTKIGITDSTKCAAYLIVN